MDGMTQPGEYLIGASVGMPGPAPVSWPQPYGPSPSSVLASLAPELRGGFRSEAETEEHSSSLRRWLIHRLAFLRRKSIGEESENAGDCYSLDPVISNLFVPYTSSH